MLFYVLIICPSTSLVYLTGDMSIFEIEQLLRVGDVRRRLSAYSIFIFSYKNHLTIHNFYCTIANIIHPSHPRQLVGSFELFDDAFFFGAFFYQPEKNGLHLFFDVGKLGMEFSRSEQIVIQNFAVVL